MSKICIGEVLKPQGVVGELKVKDLTCGFDSVKNISCVFISEKEYSVLNLRSFGGALFLTLKGVCDRNAAELLRGKEVFALRDQIALPEDEFFIVDVIGCDLFLSSGKLLGKIVDIAEGSVDVYSVKTVEGLAVFPMLKKLDPVFDLENGKVVVNAKMFTEVVIYEN